MKRFTALILVVPLLFATATISNSQLVEVKNLSISQFASKVDGIITPKLNAICSFEYQPGLTPQFFNLFILNTLMDPVHIIDNQIIFDVNHSSVPIEPISRIINLNKLGYTQEAFIQILNIYYLVTEVPLVELPPLPLNFFEPVQVSLSTVNFSGGGISEGVPPVVMSEEITIPWASPIQFSIVFNRGCSVPNHDLSGWDDENGCVPAATANSFDWMKEKFGLNFGSGLAESFNTFSNLMNRKSGEGVSAGDQIRAKLDFIEMYDLPIKVDFKSVLYKKGENVSSTSGNSKANNSNTGDSLFPDLPYLQQKGIDNCDVEMWLFSGDGISHVVALTGAWDFSIFGVKFKFITFKHDYDQADTDEDRGSFGQKPARVNEASPVGEVSAGPYGSQIQVTASKPDGSGDVSSHIVPTVVSECYDPNHKPRNKKPSMKKFCQTETIIVPPKKSLVVQYPDESGRCMNSTIYTGKREPEVSDTIRYKREAVWNYNQGKERRIANTDSVPMYVQIHNDDNRSPRDGSEGNAYDISFSISDNTSKKIIQGNVVLSDDGTDPSNEEIYGGFSIGWNDSSEYEFGKIDSPEYSLNYGIGNYLNQFPKAMSPIGLRHFEINYPIKKHNTYWNDLEMVLGVAKLRTPGWLYYTSASNDIFDSIYVSTAGIINRPFGKCSDENEFDVTLYLDANLDFSFDHFAIASIREFGWAEVPIAVIQPEKTDYCIYDNVSIEFDNYEKFDYNNVFYLEMSKSDDFSVIDLVVEYNSNEMSNTVIGFGSNAIAGEYFVRIRARSPEFVSNSIRFIMHESPEKPEIIVNNYILTAPKSSSYQWFKDGELLDEDGQIFNAEGKPGTYTLIVANEFCLSPISEPVEITNVGMKDIVLDDILIFPVPANEYLNIVINDPKLILERVELRDIFGQILIKSDIADESVLKLSVSDFPAGIYYLIFSGRGKTIGKKVVISE